MPLPPELQLKLDRMNRRAVAMANELERSRTMGDEFIPQEPMLRGTGGSTTSPIPEPQVYGYVDRVANTGSSYSKWVWVARVSTGVGPERTAEFPTDDQALMWVKTWLDTV